MITPRDLIVLVGRMTVPPSSIPGPVSLGLVGPYGLIRWIISALAGSKLMFTKVERSILIRSLSVRDSLASSGVRLPCSIISSST